MKAGQARRAPKPRELRAKLTSEVAVAPILVSDQTCHAAAGLTDRQFRAFVRERGIAHVIHGRRLLVRAEDLAAAIGSAEPAELGALDDDADEAHEPTRAEILLRIAGGRR